MHDLHQHLTQILTEKLQSRRVITWYDPRREFEDYLKELAGGALPDACRVDRVKIGSVDANLCVMQESFFEVKFAVEPLVAGDLPDPLLIYLPGKNRDDETAVFMELEAGGQRWVPSLRREARRVLKKQYGDGQIDQMLDSDHVTYHDIVALLEAESPTGSLLSVIFSNAHGSNTSILADWLAHNNHDAEILEKSADGELRQLVGSRLGLELPEDGDLEDARHKTIRYVLLGEFRSDLEGQVPDVINMVAQPATKDQLHLVLEVAAALRTRHRPQYLRLADQVEREFSLSTQGVAPEKLGRIDTFRFEERSLLKFAGELIVDGQFDQAREVVEKRRRSFWAEQPIQRQEQWRAYELAAELGEAVRQTVASLPDSGATAIAWVEGYTNKDGWYRTDLVHRRLESTLATMTEHIASEQVVHRVRNDYDALLDTMTRGFVKAFGQSDWSIPGLLHQTEVYTKKVESTSETVCYVLVDALRYEMGVELQSLLEEADDLSLEPAVAAIPTITPIGMAALMPGADQSFSVIEKKGKLAARIDNSEAADRNDRRKIWKGRVPKVVDIELEKVLSRSTSQLKKRLADARLILVRSVEIDAMGEGGNTLLARQVIDTAIGNVARAIKRLAGLGVSKFVVAADHGHLFANERDESQRIDNPAGEQVELHRRCWAGRGGANPPATVRISGSQLGYDTDLDFVFPANNSVFKAGGDLNYHHGGLSLQELLVPVLSVRMPAKEGPADTGIRLKLTHVPKQIATRMVAFGVTAFDDQPLLDNDEEIVVRPALISKGSHIGHADMALDAELDSLTHCVKLRPGGSCRVGIKLLREDVDTVEIVILDPSSDRILVQSDKIPVRLGI